MCVFLDDVLKAKGLLFAANLSEEVSLVAQRQSSEWTSTAHSVKISISLCIVNSVV